jgi:hypothetical protein
MTFGKKHSPRLRGTRRLGRSFPMNTPSSTQSVLEHHLKGIGNSDVADILSDYAEQSVLYTPNGPISGLAALKQFFTEFFATIPPTFMSEFKMLRQDISGDVAYIVWRSGVFLQGTDTFVVRNGKISVQTFAAYVPA